MMMRCPPLLEVFMKLRTGIEIVMGRPGSGKSTYAAALARRYQKKGYPVWSSTDIKGCYKLDVLSDLMTYEISDGLVLIDEAGLDFDSRAWKNFTRDQVEFFKMHRHYHLRIVVLSQYWDDVDKKIRVISDRISCLVPTVLGFGFVCLRDIKMYIGISEDKQIVQQFDFKPRLFGGIHYYWKWAAFPFFDTHSRRSLPDRDWPTWGPVPSSRLHKLYHIPKSEILSRFKSK